MPEMQFENERGRRSVAETLARWQNALCDERGAGKGSRAERAAWLALDIVAPTALCIGLFLLTRVAMVFWN